MCIRDRNIPVRMELGRLIRKVFIPAEDWDVYKRQALFHVVNDIERIGDHAENLADSAQTRIKEQIAFSDTALEELREMGLSLIHI